MAMDGTIIYTAIAGGYDMLKEPRRKDPTPSVETIAPGVRVIHGVHGILGAGRHPTVPDPSPPRRLAFVDNPVLCGAGGCPGWEVTPMSSICMEPLMQAKRYKVLAHEVLPAGTEYSLWVDGSIEVAADLRLEDLIEWYLGDHDISLFPHPYRDCAYDEAHKCGLGGLDDHGVMARQMNRYRREGYPRDNGLAECGVILRRHTPDIARLEGLWWGEINCGSRRDQLSFDYCCWKLGIRYRRMPGHICDNPHFVRHRHVRGRTPSCDGRTR